MDWHALSDQRIIEELGVQLRAHRLKQNFTQQQLAEMAGVDRATISQMENGRAVNLLTFIQVLRGLQLLDELDAFTSRNEPSPLQILRDKASERQRASGKRSPGYSTPPEW